MYANMQLNFNTVLPIGFFIQSIRIILCNKTTSKYTTTKNVLKYVGFADGF
jgi:hypothetical protein